MPSDDTASALSHFRDVMGDIGDSYIPDSVERVEMIGHVMVAAGELHIRVLHEWRCPSCGATTRARMADAGAATAPRFPPVDAAIRAWYARLDLDREAPPTDVPGRFRRAADLAPALIYEGDPLVAALLGVAAELDGEPEMQAAVWAALTAEGES